MRVLAAPVILKLTPELAGILLSPEEFDAIEDYNDLYNYELVHGVLVVAPPPDIGEREPNEQLGHLSRSYKEQHPQGAALNALSCHDVVTCQDGICRYSVELLRRWVIYFARDKMKLL